MVSERERGGEGESGGRESLWAVVLAGGEGTSLGPALVQHLCGDERLEQFAPLLGTRRRCARPRPSRAADSSRADRGRHPAGTCSILDRELSEKPRLHVLRSRRTAGRPAESSSWRRSESRRGIRGRRSCAFRRIIPS